MALPDIIAGPILRRAEEDRVCVWIATSTDPALGLELTILDVSTPYREVGLPSTSGCTTIRAGEHLFVSLVTAYPDAPSPKVGKFPKDTLLAYELWFTRETSPGVTQKLELNQLLESYADLVYDGVGMPTFYLQGGDTLILLHGSCRKPHGRGADALPAADTLIGRRPRDLTLRPCMLCLTGDQIYANSVHADPLHQAHRVLRELFGYDESVPVDSGSTTLKDLADVARTSKRPALAKKAGLDADEWPLFGLGEMLAMHVLSWSAALWRSFSPVTRANMTNAGAAQGLYEIKAFITGLPAVMRALANAPTYMIFDDHEVTDDWNLHKEWKARVENSDLGRRLVTNALVAYWLCQAWGNDPSRFDATFAKTVQDCCDLLRTNQGKVPATMSRSFDTFFWSFHDWGFITPTTPPVFFLDTRTRRELYARGRAPKLLSDAAWASFIQESVVSGTAGFGSKTARVTIKRGDPLVLVAPTPVFGMLFTEAYDKSEFLKKGPESPDFEHWRFNQRAHHDFIKGLITRFAPRYCVFLSGDVHASFTAEVDYMLAASAIPADVSKGPPAADLANARRLYQFTASPLKNENHTFGAQVDATRLGAATALSLLHGINMWESWDLVGYDKQWRHRVAARLQHDPAFSGVYNRLYVQFMDGQAPDDPFVTMSLLVAMKLQDLRMGPPLWRETGRYYRHYKKDSDSAPFYPLNNIGLVRITPTRITHELCSVTKPQRLMPAIQRFPYTSNLP